MFVRLAIVFALIASSALGHARWKCPTPRSTNAALKTGPCGGEGSITTGTITEIAPGPYTVVFEETIYHTGSPFRIALTDVSGSDSFGSCILLDHIPHNNAASSVSGIYAVTVQIPDVACEYCALQLIQIMTDKINANLGTSASTCTYNPAATTSWTNNQCGSNYHSCANVKITGTGTLSSTSCSNSVPGDWPYPTATGAAGLVYSEEESASWNGTWLEVAPSSVNAPAGDCVSVLETVTGTTAAPTSAPTSSPTGSGDGAASFATVAFGTVFSMAVALYSLF